MRDASEAPDPFRQAIHDLNGELFLIRGHVELARAANTNESVAAQLDAIFRHTDSMANATKRLRELHMQSLSEQ